jgi:hypothetical protein
VKPEREEEQEDTFTEKRRRTGKEWKGKDGIVAGKDGRRRRRQEGRSEEGSRESSSL